jgi:hypothetical protein
MSYVGRKSKRRRTPMKNQSHKSRRRQMRTFAIVVLLSAAWIGSAAAAVTPGKWTGGDPGSNTPFFMCLNVSEDGQRLTAVGTQCLGNQGQQRNVLDINWQSGTTPEGFGCNQNSYRGATQGDLVIGTDGTFTHTFNNAAVKTTVTGQFDSAGTSVSGTARTIVSNFFFSINCSVDWTATPAAAGPPDTVDPPSTPAPAPPPGSTAPSGLTPGQWVGGNPGNTPFSICLNVSQDGQRVTSVGTQCTGNQGQNRRSVDINWQSGTTPDGSRCNQNSYRGADQGDLQIGQQGYFTHTFNNAFVNTTVTGKFDPATQTAEGTARTINPHTNCAVRWTARPAP